ncbi:MAG: hypothetical protein HY303_05075 [Candidatus Wallbacteria bacterium]|nr:hypothetical protein [Candidatus Wallbacteria bacterium]
MPALSIAEAVAEAIKKTLLPEIAELKLSTAKIAVVLDATVARLDRMQQEMDRRFDLVDKRFEQIDKRFEQIDKRIEQVDRRIDETRAEHSKRMDLLEARVVEVRSQVVRVAERQEKDSETIGRLALLGDYVRRIDEMAVEMREQRRRLDELERRLGAKPAGRLPRVAGR